MEIVAFINWVEKEIEASVMKAQIKCQPILAVDKSVQCLTPNSIPIPRGLVFIARGEESWKQAESRQRNMSHLIVTKALRFSQTHNFRWLFNWEVNLYVAWGGHMREDSFWGKPSLTHHPGIQVYYVTV